MLATCVFIHANVIDIERLDVLKQDVVLDFIDLAKGISMNRAVIINEDWLQIIGKQGTEFLLVIFGGVRLEQVGTYFEMHHVHLVQQLKDALNVSVVGFSDHERTVLNHKDIKKIGNYPNGM